MIKHITVDGKQYPIRISYFALKKTEEDTGKSLVDIKDNDYLVYETLLYYSLLKGAEITGEPMKFQKADMEKVMDEVFFDFIALIPLFFTKQEKNVLQEKRGERPPKK